VEYKNNSEVKTLKQNNSDLNIRELKATENTNKICRICLSDEKDEEKGFIPINVCNCKGRVNIFRVL
jgi:hypothetical protein